MVPLIFVAFVLLACAPAQGWRPTSQRICERGGPAIVCVEVEPDRPLRFDLGGTALLPGECALAPKKGGLLRVSVDDGRAHEIDARWLRAPRGRVTWLGVRERKLRVRIDDRERCDRRPWGDLEPSDRSREYIEARCFVSDLACVRSLRAGGSMPSGLDVRL